MSDPRFTRLMDLVEAATERAPHEGDALLVRECGDDRELLAEARELVALARTESGDGFTEVLQQGIGAAAERAARAGNVPERIGLFQIIDKLGEGGMGAVFLARQESPIRRDVALKVVRAGYADRHLIARFEAERQALASLEHPNIARVYDASATEEGLPYFAMEYVRGEPITEYGDRLALSLEARLSLFLQVCRAIQHAHFHGIIHRDIKPSNVLVTEVDDEGVVKVIDFGIAKFVSGLAGGEQAHTQLGAMVGTLGYMSPEQAEGAAVVDTRTDVYSLGVLLYDLASGGLPFESDTLRGLSPAQVREVLSSSDPPRPSVRLAEAADAEGAASRRRSDPRSLRRRLQGDLDWVVMKALEREPDRRYASPLELAGEVERILRHEPVQASARTVVTRAAKFYRRHRLPVTAAAVVFLAVVSGATLSTLGFLRAAEERRVAEREAAVATQTSRFLTQSLATARPAEVEGGETTVRDILDLAVARLEDESGTMIPEVEARLRYTIGASYASLAVYDRAIEHLRRAHTLLAESGGATAEQAGQALSTLSDIFDRRGQHFIAQIVNQQLLDLQARTHGADSTEYAVALLRIGRTHAAMGDRGRAQAVLDQARALHQALGPPSGPDPLADALDDLAAVLAD